MWVIIAFLATASTTFLCGGCLVLIMLARADAAAKRVRDQEFISKCHKMLHIHTARETSPQDDDNDTKKEEAAPTEIPSEISSEDMDISDKGNCTRICCTEETNIKK